MKQRSLLWLSVVLALGVLLPSSRVFAGGLYLFDRGARPLSRGGAFVAGADDTNALWYNPAGLSYAGNQVMGDATLTLVFAKFRRLYDDGTFADEVKAKPMPLPIPTLAFSNNFGLKKITFGAGIFAPNATIINWPSSIPRADGVRDPSPTRYSIIGLRGSILASIIGGGAYKLTKDLSIGADAHVTLGRFKAQTALSACDGAICNFPEDPEFDAYATLDTFPLYGFTGTFGLTYDMLGLVRYGVSVTLPYSWRGPTSIDLVMPQNQLFANAKLSGDKAQLEIKMPTIVRVGSEIRPLPYLRMEGAMVWEQWSRQKEITVTSENLQLQDVRGIGNYDVDDIAIQRKMRNTWSLRGGFELFVPARWMIAKWKNLNLALRGGLAYEKGAFGKQLTPLTLDTDKVLISSGLSFDLAKWLRFDGSAGYYYMVDPKIRDSGIKQPTAIRPGYADASTLGNGNYKVEAFFLGGGFVVRMD